MDLSDLRQAAIEMLGPRCDDTGVLHQQTPLELIHELRVQQAELEMQNEELRRVQIELEASRDKFSNLFDFAPVGYVTLDAANRIIEANLTIAKLLGVERGKLIGAYLGQYVAPENANELHRHLQDVVSSNGKASCKLTFQTAGDAVRVRLDSISITGDGRSVAITDLRENASLMQAKRDSDERLKIICHALPVPIAYLDQGETYQFNNAAHEGWFKFPRQLFMGRSVREFLGDEVYEQVKPSIRRVLAGQPTSCRVDLTNGPRTVEVHYAPHRNRDEQVIGCYELMFDVTAHRHFEEEESRRLALEMQLQKLSGRQRLVFDLLMDGLSNKAITLKLDVGMRTVERERHEILRLLGVGSINEMLVVYAGLARVGS